MFMNVCVFTVNTMYDYKYEGLRGCSYSWLKHLIYMQQFIVNLNTTPRAATIAALQTPTHREVSGT